MIISLPLFMGKVLNTFKSFLFSCYRGGTFLFSFQVSPIYPHEAPKVKCKTKVNEHVLSPKKVAA